MHVLLADDDESIALVARLGLKRAGYTVTIVETGRKALEAARTNEFGALLLDWHLPDVDGIDICRELVADASWPRVPIVFLTGASHDGFEQEAADAGAIGLIQKPFDPMQVGEQLRAILEAG